MAKKKPTPPDEGPKPRGRSRPKPAAGEAKAESVPPASEAGRPRPRSGPPRREAEPSRLDQARELAVQAAEALDPRRRVALARQALTVSPDCAEAYYLLADHART